MVPYLSLRRASRTSRETTTAAMGAQGLATEYDLLQLAKLPHSGASVAFVAPCRRAALWLEEGLAANARSLRPSPLSLREPCEACVPRWRRRPARPHRRPARPIDTHAVPKSVRRRWMAHRPSLKARHSAQPPRVSVPCLSLPTCGNGRLNSSSSLNGRASTCIVSRKAFTGRWCWLDIIGGGRISGAAFCGGDLQKFAKHSVANMQGVATHNQCAELRHLRVRLDMTRVL